MAARDTIYDDLGVPRVINGVGTRTQVSGARLRDGVAEAMARAAEAHVYVADLQARASDLIAEATGAEAGFVAPGASAAMCLGAAACIAGDDYATMARLPDTEGVASDVVIPKAHRIKYDVGIRASGATLVDAGGVSHHPVEGGVERVEPWELDAAIDGETVAVAYVQRPHNRLALPTVVDVAHDHDLPVLVDAASEVPPQANLRRFVDAGADLVAISGGKGIRGPQPTGILAGRTDLIRSAALQQLSDGYHADVWSPPERLIDRAALPPGTPPTGLGRPLKVGREDLVGLLVALEGFLAEDHEATLATWRARAERIAEGLGDSPHLNVRLSAGTDKASGVPKVVAGVAPDAPRSAVEVVRTLRRGDPRVWVGERRVDLDEITVAPQELTDEEADYLVERVLAAVDAA
ncbi:MAG: aminotransferase class V-fold PLP-dependent enzyme [Haloferacaceae archaeon]